MSSQITNPFLPIATAEMASRGMTVHENSAELTAKLDALLAEGRAFFAKSLTEKQLYAAGPGCMTGWREIGIEYSQSPDRPDQNETFCFRRRDVLGDAVEALPLVAAARAAQQLLDQVATDVLSQLKADCGVAASVPNVKTFGESWLQLNYSLPSSVGCEFIQDAHEDGHLLTFLFADAPALEVKVAGEWQEVFADSSRLANFGGECGALLTNDLISPTQHRVRARRDVASRLSVAYFVNPDLDQSLAPWVLGPRNASVDLLRWGQENPVRFGLPAL